MEYYTHVKLICLLTLFCNTKCTTVMTTEKQGACRINGVKQCCAMYYLVNGDCVVCPNGTYRYDDDNLCTKCPSGMYGRYCAYKCNCERNQICDPSEGCTCVDCVQETTTLTGSSSHSTVAVGFIGLFVIIGIVIISICAKRLYDDFIKEHAEIGSSIGERLKLCCIYYMNKLKKTKFRTENDFNDALEENPYCVIRESAMIRTLNSCSLSLVLDDESYNRLNGETSCTYSNSNEYSKMYHHGRKQLDVVRQQNYDRMMVQNNVELNNCLAKPTTSDIF